VSDSVSELPHQTSSTAATASTTKQRRWQMTMPELTEAPETNTLSTHGQKQRDLAAAALAISRGEYPPTTTPPDEPRREIPDAKVPLNNSARPIVDVRAEKRRYIKNLLVLSVAYFFLFSSYSALRNLQSSLNAASGLGLYALSSMYLSLVFGSLCSTMVVQRLGPKRALSLSLVGFVMYSAANFYPRFYTMIPASVVHGYFMAVGYTAHSTYLANISAGYADLLGRQMKHVLSQFHGTYFIFLQFSQIAGGLISSLLLSQPVAQSNDISYAGLTYPSSNHSYLLGAGSGGSLYVNGISASNGSSRFYGAADPGDVSGPTYLNHSNRSHFLNGTDGFSADGISTPNDDDRSLFLNGSGSGSDGISDSADTPHAGLHYPYNSSHSSLLNRSGGGFSGDGISSSVCGSSSCPSDSETQLVQSNSAVDATTLLVLMACFGASTLAGCLIMVLALDPLDGLMATASSTPASLGQQMTAVLRFFMQRHARLVVGLSFYSLLQVTFMFGEFTKVSPRSLVYHGFYLSRFLPSILFSGPYYYYYYTRLMALLPGLPW